MNIARVGEVRVGAQRYTVQARTELDLDGMYGRMVAKHALIEINESAAPRQRADTFVHEIMHALFSDAGIDITAEHEEMLVSALAPRLTAFLSDNKAVVREILKAL